MSLDVEGHIQFSKLRSVAEIDKMNVGVRDQ